MWKKLAAPTFALSLLWLLSSLGIGAVLSNEGMDLLFRLRGPRAPDQRIIIIGVDEISLARHGQWPFPRRTHALLLSRLAQARAIGFDFLFAEPHPDDPAFNQALRQAPPVVMAVARNGENKLLRPASSLSGYQALGHIETILSGDGLVRQVSLSPPPDPPSFALSLLRAAQLKTPTSPSAQPVLINYYGPESTFLTLSYAEVLAGRYPANFFQGRLVLIGAEALGLGDAHVTAFTHQEPTPGVEIQATILNNLLHNAFLRRLPWLSGLFILLISGMAVLVWPRLSERLNMLINASVVVLSLILAVVLFQRNLFFNYAWPLLFLFFVYLTHLFMQLLSATQRILRHAQRLDLQLDERLQQIHGHQPTHPPRRSPMGIALLSPSGMHDHLSRLQAAIDALQLQHLFLENLLQKELPPLILWEENGKPVFANLAFRDLWRVLHPGPEDTSLPEEAYFLRIASQALSDAPSAKEDAPQLLDTDHFELRTQTSSGRRFHQGELHRLDDHTAGFKGRLALLQDVTSIRELERMKDEVVSIVSHELKQPLTVILGYGQMLSERLSGPQLDFARKICAQAERLNRMIRDFLDIARLESGRQQVKKFPFPMQRMLEEALDSMESAAAKKSIRFERRLPLQTSVWSGDEGLLVHAVLNLLDNAVKFSPPHSVVRLSLEERHDAFVIQVADQGPGIPASERQSIFGKFQRGSRTQKDEGFGLGLHLVRQIIEGHGGRIEAMEAIAGFPGAVFAITLPK